MKGDVEKEAEEAEVNKDEDDNDNKEDWKVSSHSMDPYTSSNISSSNPTMTKKKNKK